VDVTRLDSVDVAAAALAGIAAVVGSYAAVGATPAFVAAPVAGVVGAFTPDAVVTFAILVLGSLGSKLAFGLALGVTAVVLGSGALAGIAVGRVRVGRHAGSALAAVAVWLEATVLTGRPVVALAAAAPAGAVAWLATRESRDGAVVPGRRRVLQVAAGVAGVGVATTLLRGGGEAAPAEPSEFQAAVQPKLDTAADQSLDVDGLKGLVSTKSEFYKVDTTAVDPEMSRDDWSLSVTGAVEEEVTLDFDDLRALPAEHRYVTLRCVGEGLNGHKMDTAVWTGVGVTDLLASAGVTLPDDCCVMLRAADDYYEEFPLAALEDGFLAYGMNGEKLPRGHGRPVRALIPGHWGEINVKWVTEIEVLEEEAQGYWEERGWHGTGPVNTVAKLHATNQLDDGRTQVAGHAYAGTRGIQAVEVSTDGGDTWQDAELSPELPGDDVWRQWAFAFQPSGTHEVVVRAIDGTGTVQAEERSDAFPSGATGWVTKTVQG
jgi:DMSO/TMAO reductase YedYZ molybdopterin-dependent catalytic subunit